MNRLESKGIQIPNAIIAAIGSKTKELLQEYGLSAHVLPEKFTAASLLKTIEQKKIKNTQVLLPVSAIARDELYMGLKSLGANVQRIVVYQNRLNQPKNKDNVIKAILNGNIDMLIFFSPSAVQNFASIIGQYTLAEIRHLKLLVAVIGPTTAAAVRELGLTPHIEPLNYTTEELIHAITDYYKTVKV